MRPKLSVVVFIEAPLILIAGHLEIALCGPLRPGAGDGPVVGADVVHLSVRNDLYRISGLVLAFPLQMNRPLARIQSSGGERNRTRPRIDHSRHVFRVPLHVENQASPLACRRRPVTMPSAGHWMPFLARQGDQQPQAGENPYTESSAMHIPNLT